jgi:hypothetical protein
MVIDMFYQEPTQRLSSALYSNMYGQLKVLDIVTRNPLVLDIEVKTDRFFAIGPCKDVSIIVYGMDGRVITSGVAKTSTLNQCRGQIRLVFPPDYNPAEKVQIQLIGGTNPNAIANSSMWEGKYMSNPLNFVNTQNIVARPEEPSAFDGLTVAGINTTLKSVTTLIVIGIGMYVLLPFLPVAQSAAQTAATKMSEKQKKKTPEVNTL